MVRSWRGCGLIWVGWGSNLNQLTRGMHLGQIVSSDELVPVLGEVSAQLAEVRKALL